MFINGPSPIILPKFSLKYLLENFFFVNSILSHLPLYIPAQ